MKDENKVGLLKIIFERIFCKHEWGMYSFSSVKCKKCNAIKCKPSLASKLLEDHCNKQVEEGIWKQDDVDKQFMLITHQLIIKNKSMIQK